MAGNGVHMAHARHLVQELAELWSMPVATSYKGKSVIEETHPLAVGMVGVFGQRAANSVVGEADTVLVVGARLSSQETVKEQPEVFDPRRQRIIQIDIEPLNTGWTFPHRAGPGGGCRLHPFPACGGFQTLGRTKPGRDSPESGRDSDTKAEAGLLPGPLISDGLFSVAAPAPGPHTSGYLRPRDPDYAGRGETTGPGCAISTSPSRRAPSSAQATWLVWAGAFPHPWA